MRILVNARFLIKGRLEGIGRYSYEILQRLVTSQPKDHFIFCFDRPFEEDFIFGPNVEGIVIWPPARHPALFFWWFEVGIPKAYKRYQADIFFSVDGFLSLSSRVDKNLLVVHDLAYHHYPHQLSTTVLWYYQRFTPRFVEKADHIITVSYASLQDIETIFPAARGKVSVSYNGCRSIFRPQGSAVDELTRMNCSGGHPYFLIIGAIHPRKNLERVLKAFGVFKSKSPTLTKLLIVGRKAWQTQSVESIYQRHSHRDEIVFLGYLEDDYLAKLLSASKGLIFVSLFEGFGLPIVEAMQTGVPVITSDRSSMVEVGGQAAILVNPESVQEIAEAMSLIDRDDQKVIELIERGFKRSADFSWDRAAEQVSEKLKFVVHNRS